MKMKFRQFTPIISKFLLLFFPVTFFLLFFYSNFQSDTEQQFIHLAQAFLRGKLYFLEQPGASWLDTTLFNGKHYWPLGPFPAIALMIPLIVSNYLHISLRQGYINFILIGGIFYLVHKLALQLKYSRAESIYLSIGFCFGSVLLGPALSPWGWYFAHTITVFLSFLALVEFLGKKRFWLVGILLSMAIATRITLLPIAAFFFFSILFGSAKVKDKIVNIAFLSLPILITFLFLGAYNYARFGNILETGYHYQLLIPVHEVARAYGMTSLTHLAGNLYYFLLAVPQPVFADAASHILKFPFVRADHWGMSIFITSPYFVYLFVLKYWDKFSLSLIISLFFCLIPLLLYYGIGYRQFGYRYSLDFLPLLFFLLIRNYHQQVGSLSLKFRFLILFSACANLYLFFTFLAFP